MDLLSFINEQTSWLYTILFQNELFFIDFWSLTYCWSGFFLFFIIKFYKNNRAILYLLIVLICFEIIEITTRYLFFKEFLPESIKDQFSDILVGMSGGLIAYFFLGYLLKFPRHRKFQLLLIASFTAVIYSFSWVGSYQYEYNMGIFNTKGLNFGAFLFWWAGAWGTIEFYKLMKMKRFIYRLLITWAGFIILLFLFEYIAYDFVKIHEISRNGVNPLVFDLIHGTWFLHLIYMISPLISINLYRGFLWIIQRCIPPEMEQPTVLKK